MIGIPIPAGAVETGSSISWPNEQTGILIAIGICGIFVVGKPRFIPQK